MNNAIILAAGSGSRMGMDTNKVLLDLMGKPVIIWTIEKFYCCRDVDDIYLVIRKEDEKDIIEMLNKYEFSDINIVYGGKERQDSIYNALNTMDDCDIVLIHDGARPFIEEQTIEKSIIEAVEYSAVCVGVPVTDTIKVLKKGNFIAETPDRNTLWAAQTPQVFRYDLIKKAYKNAYEKNIFATDDSSLVENTGEKVKMIRGSYKNIKITTVEDLALAKSFMENEEKSE